MSLFHPYTHNHRVRGQWEQLEMSLGQNIWAGSHKEMNLTSRHPKKMLAPSSTLLKILMKFFYSWSEFKLPTYNFK